MRERMCAGLSDPTCDMLECRFAICMSTNLSTFLPPACTYQLAFPLPLCLYLSLSVGTVVQHMPEDGRYIFICWTTDQQLCFLILFVECVNVHYFESFFSPSAGHSITLSHFSVHLQVTPLL